MLRLVLDVGLLGFVCCCYTHTHTHRHRHVITPPLSEFTPLPYKSVSLQTLGYTEIGDALFET